ncbi:MAG: hypothetical protein VX964_03435 [Verrucomicrobiota bacterium]|nr:hypothetical protein [Verrucomicrobiota bacterium]
MPRVLYTTAKGLHQDSGDYCELPIKKKVIALTNAATTARTLAVGESGSIVTLDASTDAAQTITVTLPTANDAARGVYYDFCFIADAGNAAADVIITTGANGTDIFGYMVRGNANSTVLDFNGISKITADASVGTDWNGARLTLLCDGTHWHLSGYSKVAIGTVDFVESATA